MPDTRKKINYAPVLFAVGNYIEERNWRDICILEAEGGLIVQGTGLLPTGEGYQYTMETKLFSHEELAKMMKK